MDQNGPKYLNFFLPLLVFAVAMGFLEAIVVVYMRELYYPEGFAFPLKPMPLLIFKAEIIREVCTLLMLATVAWLSGKTFTRRLAVFLFIFGVWDIIYYVALWLFLGWPESLLTWDILFLIPVTWTGPVLAPVLCSATMIFIAFLTEQALLKNQTFRLGAKELSLFFGGAFIIFISFIYDFLRLVAEGNFFNNLFSPPENTALLIKMYSFVPEHFQWEIFTIGLIITFLGVLPMLKKHSKQFHSKN